jgi:hypothetical protein
MFCKNRKKNPRFGHGCSVRKTSAICRKVEIGHTGKSETGGYFGRFVGGK